MTRWKTGCGTAFLTRGLSIELADMRETPVRRDIFCFADGLRDFTQWLNRDNAPLYPEIICGLSDSEGIQVRLPSSTPLADKNCLCSFANNISTPEGGTHVTGFYTALVRAMNNCARNLKLLGTPHPPLTRAELEEGLTAVVSVRMGGTAV